MDDPPWLLLTTVGRAEDARRLAQELVERRLAACVHIDAIDSVYRWQGAVHADAEYRLLVKTAADRVPQLMAALRALHPYEQPALHAWPAGAADGGYAAWVQDCTRDPVGDAGAG
jgi:periplasmic divalent cation tolerance protein